LVLAWTSLAFLLPLAATGCGHKEAEDTGPRVMEVETTNPQRKDLTREIEQPGYLRPFEVTPIYTKIAGFAEYWYPDLGDRVKKGDPLVDLYVPEVETELLVKKARVKQATADVKQSKEFAKAAKANEESALADIDAKAATIRSIEADVKRWSAEDVRSKKLFLDKVYDKQTWDEVVNQLNSSRALREEAVAKWISSQAKWRQAAANYNKSEADVEVATANLSVAEAARDQWRDWLAYRYITAPYDGVVTLRNVALGDFLQPTNSGSTSKAAEPLYIMMRTDTMRCTIEVPEMDAVLLKDGDTAEVYLQAMPGAPIIGRVKRNSGALDIHSRTLRVEVYLDNPDNKYLPAMYAKVTIKAKMPQTWSLPVNVVMNDILANGDRRYCFVVEDGKARKTFLEVGKECDEGMPIFRKQRFGNRVWEEFTGKEAVVTTNSQALLDGQAVRIKAPASP
jgi:RND family efflux transporter MFP subunit